MAQSVQAANPFAVDPDDELPVGLQLTLRLRALIAGYPSSTHYEEYGAGLTFK